MKNLKKQISLYLSFTAILFLTLNTNAQSIELGVRFMPTFSSFDVQTSDGGTVKGQVTMGYGYGGLLGFNFNDHIGIQGEIIYSSISQKNTDVSVEQRIDLKYINIPVMLSLNTDKSLPFNLNIVAGPQLGINVGSDIQTTGDDGVVTTQAILAVKKSDIGVAYGAGLDFGLLPMMRLGFGFRGVFGLLDISDQSKSIETDAYYVLDRTHVSTYSGYIGLSIVL